MARRKSSSRKPSRSTSRRASTAKRSRRTSWRTPLLVVAGVVLLLLFAALAGWLGYRLGHKEADRACRSRIADYREDLAQMRRKLREREADLQRIRRRHTAAPSKKPAAAPLPPQTSLSEVRDFLNAAKKRPAPAPVAPTPKEEKKGHRPMLAIIIDDVGYRSQVRAIRALPWHITPSLFPPTSRHPDTPKIAASLRHYMIHLPMEALRFHSPEAQTLTVSSTSEAMERRLADLRRWFPTAHFLNNHTGSRFTSDTAAMERFYPLARRYGFVFVDSRTTPHTVVARLCRRHGDPYIARDIFLDNKPDIAYIQNQLKKAVRLARRHGYAIAIGHPHATTLKALAASGSILKGVDVVYIDELYRAIRKGG